MNYKEKKEELIKERNDLLKEYETFFYKTMELAAKMGNISEGCSLSSTEMIDWLNYLVSDLEMDKFGRLVAALQYVEEPEDKEVIFNLKENIEINNSKTK